MKIRPVILCGGAGTRLWENKKHHQPKQFINFGGWNLFEKTLNRIKEKKFDDPIISTNLKYLKQVKQLLRKAKIRRYDIVLEPAKKNTAPAILCSTLIAKIPFNQPLIFFPADHLIKNSKKFNNIIFKNQKNLNNQNILLFGIKPNVPSKEYGYFLTKKIPNKPNKIIKFIEKPAIVKAKKLIKKGGCWNSGIFFARKDSIINHFKKYQSVLYKNCYKSVLKSKIKKNIHFLNKPAFVMIKPISFDYAILEKTKNISGIIINISWTDFGNWKEILKNFYSEKPKYFNKINVYYRPWGSYVNLFHGKNFLIKELTVNPKSSISLQKHRYRSEHWMVIRGKPMITLNKRKFFKKINETIFIPVRTIHRIENLYNNPVKIMEAQIGSILKETDIVRYKDIYGRVN